MSCQWWGFLIWKCDIKSSVLIDSKQIFVFQCLSSYRGITNINVDCFWIGHGHLICIWAKTGIWISHLTCDFPIHWHTALQWSGFPKDINEIQNPLDNLCISFCLNFIFLIKHHCLVSVTPTCVTPYIYFNTALSLNEFYLAIH